jgi:hypothetical protein
LGWVQVTIYQKKAMDINEWELGLDHLDIMKSCGDGSVLLPSTTYWIGTQVNAHDHFILILELGCKLGFFVIFFYVYT